MPILFFDQNKITVASDDKQHPAYWEIAYDYNNLTQAFKEINTHLPSNKYLLILTSTLSYTITLDIPLTTTTPTRFEIKNRLIPEIPEVFTDTQFDWKITPNNQIEAVVVTTPAYQAISQLIALNPQINFVTRSLLSIQKEGNLPTDINYPTPELFAFARTLNNVSQQKDSELLNVPITKINLPQQNILPQKTIIIILLSLFFIIGISLMIFKKEPSTPIPSPIPTLSPKPSSLPTPTTKPISSYTIQILNSTKKNGLAKAYQIKFDKLNVASITIGNQETPQDTTTVISKEVLSADFQAQIIEILSPLNPVFSLDSNNSNYDIVIILSTT